MTGEPAVPRTTYRVRTRRRREVSPTPFSEWLNDACWRRRMSARELSDYAGCHYYTALHWLHGRAVPSRHHLDDLAALGGIAPEELYVLAMRSVPGHRSTATSITPRAATTAAHARAEEAWESFLAWLKAQGPAGVEPAIREEMARYATRVGMEAGWVAHEESPSHAARRQRTAS